MTGDLRLYGYDVILHLCCVHAGASAKGKLTTDQERRQMRAEGNHKLELLDTGKRGFSFLLGECERIFDVDPLSLGVMRVDCAADVPGVGVPWFHQRARVRWKQFCNELGEICLEGPGASASLSYSQMGKREVQTLYFGKRPNCYRIYDKVAEWRVEYRRLRGTTNATLSKRMLNAGATAEDIEWRFKSEGLNPDADDCVRPFGELYGIPETGYTLTRCERQIGGGEVPVIQAAGKPRREWERLDTVAALKKRLLDYNPYREFEILAGGHAEPAREGYSLMTYMAGMYFRDRVQRDGMQQTRSWMNSHRRLGAKAPGRNAKKLIETTFADFVPPANGAISDGDLYEIYRQSLSKQMAA